jgi:hypothetical protein
MQATVKQREARLLLATSCCVNDSLRLLVMFTSDYEWQHELACSEVGERVEPLALQVSWDMATRSFSWCPVFVVYSVQSCTHEIGPTVLEASGGECPPEEGGTRPICNLKGCGFASGGEACFGVFLSGLSPSSSGTFNLWIVPLLRASRRFRPTQVTSTGRERST